MEHCPSEEIISRYLDGELDPGAVSRFEDHLGYCTPCRKAAEKLERAGDFLRRAAAGDSPPPSRLDRMVGEKFFPRSPEVFLGVIEFDLSAPNGPPARRSGPNLALAAERGADYSSGSATGGDRGSRRILSGAGIEAAVELFRAEEGIAACRIRLRDRSGEPLEGVRLQLEKEGRTVWSALSRGLEASVIPRLLPGRYRLRIERGPAYALILELR